MKRMRGMDPDGEATKSEQAKEYRKKYYAENKEKLLARQKAHYHRTKEERRETLRASGARTRAKTKAARAEYAAKYRLEHKAEIRARERLRNTGWSEDAYNAALISQEGRCAICGVEMLLGGTRPTSATADHCHAMHTPRSVLCKRCNVALGAFGDSTELMQQAIDYLKRHNINTKENK